MGDILLIPGLSTVYAKNSVLAATTTGNGASHIGIEDSAGKYTATNVETALAEVAIETETVSGNLSAHESDTSTHGVTTIAGLAENQSFTGTNKFGSATNYIQIDNNGEFTMVGTATVFDDLSVSAQTLHNGATPPSWAAYNGSLMAPSFINAATTDLHGSFEILHDYKDGIDMELHIHWSPSTTNAGNCLWAIDYSIANMTATWASPTTVTVPVAAGGVVRKHQYATLVTIVGTGITKGATIDFRIYRLGYDATDTFTGNAFLHNVGLHYEKNCLGSTT